MTTTSESVHPPSLRHEAAVIAASTGVKDGSVSISIEAESEGVSTCFTLETEVTVEDSAADIRAEEPIKLSYASRNAVGVTAPNVWCLREDFPRNLGHLNPVSADSPVSLCLARAGLQHIYDRYGVEGILQRLRTWMRDAQTGSLMADGWEPVPYGRNIDIRAGLLSARAFQEIAANHGGKAGWSSGKARITPPDLGDIVYIYPEELSATNPPHQSLLAQQVLSTIDVDKHRVGVPWAFVWSDQNTPLTDPVFGLWHTYKDMRDALALIGLANQLNNSTGSILANGCDCSHFPDGRKSLIILIGIWRPKPLLENIFGLSEDPTARSIEIKAYVLETDRHHNPVEDETKLSAIIADPWPCSELFQWTSGINNLEGVTLIGYGALGSAIADHLLRSGITGIRVIDNDKLAPHNLARHHAESHDLYRSKVNHFVRAAKSISFPEIEPDVQPYNENVLLLSSEIILERLGNSKLIIDATADEQVRGHLSNFVKSDTRQLTRVELYHQGRLGVQFVTGSGGNPDLLDLYYSLCVEALTDDAVHKWLYDEHIEGLDNEELVFGFGCASSSTRMPNYIVAQHASAFMPTIIDGIKGAIPSGVGLNILDDTHHPQGWRWINVPSFHNYEPIGAPGWTVRVHPEALSFLVSERKTALPNETGGYLYGGCDLASKQIIIVMASPLPPESKATGTSLVLGPAGNTSIERRLTRRTKNRIGLCGTWHSHPNCSSKMSATDMATYIGFVKDDWELGIPTLLLIAVEDDVSVYLQA